MEFIEVRAEAERLIWLLSCWKNLGDDENDTATSLCLQSLQKCLEG